MGGKLLESVLIPTPKSDDKDFYNVMLMEKLLRILYSSCQYGEYHIKIWLVIKHWTYLALVSVLMAV